MATFYFIFPFHSTEKKGLNFPFDQSRVLRLAEKKEEVS